MYLIVPIFNYYLHTTPPEIKGNVVRNRMIHSTRSVVMRT